MDRIGDNTYKVTGWVYAGTVHPVLVGVGTQGENVF